MINSYKCFAVTCAVVCAAVMQFLTEDFSDFSPLIY